ncbi:MAG: Nif3-like dinuclear metal center hexameric protein [Firmicutes bacterium]|nr:Nif3-like dinuclear metal center hexameric protein [Bacillota bacterium]
MKLSEIINIIESVFPTNLAYEWDNVGLLVGDRSRDIKKVFLTLDVTEKTAKEAIDAGADMILSHHPILFGGTKRITADNVAGRTLLLLIENRIAVYAAHTNCDVAEHGINANLAAMFSLSEIEPLEENGLGRVGILPSEMKFSDFCNLCKRLIDTPFVRVCGDTDIKVKKVAIGSGACADSVPFAIKKDADVMITADIKYHKALEISESGITVIDAGHFPTENNVTDIFARILKGFPIELIKSQGTDVFKLF